MVFVTSQCRYYATTISTDDIEEYLFSTGKYFFTKKALIRGITASAGVVFRCWYIRYVWDSRHACCYRIRLRISETRNDTSTTITTNNNNNNSNER